MIFRHLIIFSVCLFLAGCSSRTRPLPSLSQSVPTAEVIKGEGSPSVVFESNLGDGHEIWQLVISKIAPVTKTYAYSRNFSQVSINQSGRFTSPKTSTRIASELRERLKSRNISPPYILVGHAYGGLYVLKYAELYPGEVAGVVLVDSRPAGFTESCQQKKFANCEVPFLVQSLQNPYAQQEVRGLAESEAAATSPSQLGKIPITVITATVPNKEQSLAYQELWIRAQEQFAQDLANGRFVTALGTGHYIHTKRPNLVAEEIKKLIARNQ